MSTRATARHTRPKKLTPKQNVQIFREEQVESLIDYDAARGQVETGVDKGEEAEYHLQQAIKASQAEKAEQLKDAYIPTPPTIASNVQYDVLYPKGFQQPATYIRSSATVEDCQGVAYDMDEQDELFLKKLNVSLVNGTQPCSEDCFEEVMNFFEETAQTSQPFAAVGNAPVLSLAELEEHYDDAVPQHVRTYAKLIYDHWHARRVKTANRVLTTQLKFETGAETDDVDPYVCFRRREMRQIRKTRNRDVQSADKLRKLRFELESARNLLALVRTREQGRKQQLEIDRQLFEQRHAFRETKRKLGIKSDDELLVNQKKPKAPPVADTNSATLAQQLRVPIASGGPGHELQSLEDVRAIKDRAIQTDISANCQKHATWNAGYVDKTTAPLTPISVKTFVDTSTQFLEAVPAAAEYLPTPPASVSDDEAVGKPDADMKDVPDTRASTPASIPAFRYASPMEDDTISNLPSFRRRIGRGGRTLIDRRFPRRDKDDRFKFDHDDDDEDRIMDDAFPADDDDFSRMAHRSYLLNRSGSTVSGSVAVVDPQSARKAIESASASRSPQAAGSSQLQPSQQHSQPATNTARA